MTNIIHVYNVQMHADGKVKQILPNHGLAEIAGYTPSHNFSLEVKSGCHVKPRPKPEEYKARLRAGTRKHLTPIDCLDKQGTCAWLRSLFKEVRRGILG